MRTLYITFLLLGGLLLTTNSLDAQESFNRRWTIRTGIGYASGEYMTGGFAYGVYAGYRPYKAVELGLGITSANKQSFGRVNALSQFHPGKDNPQIIITAEDREHYDASFVANYTVSLGISPIQFFTTGSRHDVLLSGEFGLSQKGKTSHHLGKDLKSVNTYARSQFGFGARATYEYRINNMLGIGVTGQYNHVDDMLYGLGTLNVHF